jgi:hypothetical protein
VGRRRDELGDRAPPHLDVYDPGDASVDHGPTFRGDRDRLLRRSSEFASQLSAGQSPGITRPGSSDMRRPLEPGEHAQLGPGAGERRFPPTRCEGAFLDGAALAQAVHRRDPCRRGDVDLCAHRFRRVLVPAAPRAYGAALEGQERDDRRARRARGRLATEGHASDGAAYVAALPARGRLRRAMDTRWEAPPRPSLQGRGTGPLLCR